MNKTRFYTENVAFSALLGCLIGAAFMAILSSGWEENAVKYGTYAITVLVGLFASAVAIGGVLLNLEKQNELAERRHIAARAVLPLTLSRLYRLSEHGFETVIGAKQLRAGPHPDLMEAFQKLQLDSDNIQKIGNCVEAADRETQAWLSLILAHWQIEVSRIEGTLFDESRVNSPELLARSAIDWLVIRAMIIHLFDYARGGQPPSKELDQANIKVPITTNFVGNAVIAEAREAKLNYISKCGGWSHNDFKSRLVDQ